MGTIARRVTAVLRPLLVPILALLTLLVLTAVLWSFPVWRVTALVVLQRHLLLIGILGAVSRSYSCYGDFPNGRLLASQISKINWRLRTQLGKP